MIFIDHVELTNVVCSKKQIYQPVTSLAAGDPILLYLLETLTCSKAAVYPANASALFYYSSKHGILRCDSDLWLSV